MTTQRRVGALVGAVMTEEPVTVPGDAGLAQAAHLMDVHHVSGLPVVDDRGGLVGVLSETDLLRARTNADLWRNWSGLRVRDLMSAPPVTVDSDATIVVAAGLMVEAGVRRLVVTGEDGRTPIGIISMSDLVRVMADLR